MVNGNRGLDIRNTPSWQTRWQDAVLLCPVLVYKRGMNRSATSLLTSLALAALLSCAAPSSADTGSLLASMSLEEKIGQMFLVYFKGPALSPALQRMIAERHIGGVILYSNVGNIENVGQVAALTAAIQAEAAKTPKGIGIIVGIDQEGGPVIRLREGFTVFPSQMAVAATGNREHAKNMARVTAQELKTLGINCNFAPVADVNSNPDNPIIGIRSFGSDPATVSRMTAAMTAEYVRAKVICTPKHFPGHGDTNVDSHLGLPRSNHDKNTLNRVDFPPFQAAFAANAPAVMTAHVEVPALDPAPGMPATLSARVLDGTLRRQLRFKGLVVTDSLGMGALSKSIGTVEAAVRAAKAGADVLLFGADIGHEPEEQIAAFDRLVAAVKSGEVPMARIDDAVRRILEVKSEYGLLAASGIMDRAAQIPFLVHTPENLQAALDIARDALTLGRDPRRILPVKSGERLLVVWPERTAWDAVEAFAEIPGATVLRTAKEPSPSDITRAATAAAKADKVVVLTYDAVRNPAQRALLQALLTVKPMQLIHAAIGGPYDLSLFPDIPAAVATYGDVPESMQALAEGLRGKIPFQGRLPVRLQ